MLVIMSCVLGVYSIWAIGIHIRRHKFEKNLERIMDDMAIGRRNQLYERGWNYDQKLKKWIAPEKENDISKYK